MQVARAIGHAIMDPSSVESTTEFYADRGTYLSSRGATTSSVMPAATTSCAVVCSGRTSARTGKPLVDIYPRNASNVVIAHYTSEIDQDLSELFSTVDTVATKMEVSSSSGEDKNGDITGGVIYDIDQGFETLTASRLKQFATESAVTVRSEHDGLTLTDVPRDGGLKPHRLSDNYKTLSGSSSAYTLQSHMETWSSLVATTNYVSLVTATPTRVFTMGDHPTFTSNALSGFTGAARDAIPNDVYHMEGELSTAIYVPSTYTLTGVTLTVTAHSAGGIKSQDFVVSVPPGSPIFSGLVTDQTTEFEFRFNAATTFPIRSLSISLTNTSTGGATNLGTGGMTGIVRFKRACEDIPNSRTLVAIAEGLSAGDVLRIDTSQLLAVRYNTRITGALLGKKSMTAPVDESRVVGFIDEYCRGMPDAMASSEYATFSEDMMIYLQGEDALQAFSFKSIAHIAKKMKHAAKKARSIAGKAAAITSKVAAVAGDLGVPGASLVSKVSGGASQALKRYDATTAALNAL